MRELLVLSGKGGTGKTSVVGSFAVLAENKVLVDCDVDAADLHLLLHPSIKRTTEFYASKKAVIHERDCTECGRCVGVCRFDAIRDFSVDPIFCEGCGVCYHICPHDAISMEDNLSGHWFISDTPYGPMVHAKLGIAEENSGKLVAEVRQAAKAIAEEGGREYIIADGPPGIGCPVISSLSGVDLVLIITEPTIAGIHDLERVSQLVSHFDIPSMVCINKSDLDWDTTREIEEHCSQNGIAIAGRIPFADEVTQSIIDGVPLIEHSKGPASRAIESVWHEVLRTLKET